MKEQKIRKELTQVRELLADLFQSGLTNIPESLVARLSQEETFVRQYGMEWLSDRLHELTEGLKARRHIFEDINADELVALFCRIEGFVEEGIRQSSLDEAGIRIGQKDWEQEE
ncbi:MAG: hypothetical protein IKO41_02870 [Lachnospiraceae bacterium]|nr:hypothetical protein [Lachnospiraceae bacterium]MBR6151268.1 hypothetical protein [Lachnospiraceae bacterium]